MHNTVRQGRALGKLAAKDAPSIPLRAILTQRGRAADVPVHPGQADHFTQVTSWILGGNNEFGTCGPTGLANLRLLTTTYLTSKPVRASNTTIYDLYRRSGNPRFNPRTGAGDQGVVLQTMLEAAVRGGFGGVKPIAFARVDITDLDEVRAAVAIFGGLLFGADLTESQADQQVWDYTPDSDEWGGHAFMVGSYTSDAAPHHADLGEVSWAEVLGMTDEFYNRQVGEAWVVIWPEHLGSRQFVLGVDQSVLGSYYYQLTGRKLPTTAAAMAHQRISRLQAWIADLWQRLTTRRR